MLTGDSRRLMPPDLPESIRKFPYSWFKHAVLKGPVTISFALQLVPVARAYFVQNVFHNEPPCMVKEILNMFLKLFKAADQRACAVR